MSSGERKGGKKRNGGENPTEGGESPVNTIRIEVVMLEKAYYGGDSREGRKGSLSLRKKKKEGNER